MTCARTCAWASSSRTPTTWNGRRRSTGGRWTRSISGSWSDLAILREEAGAHDEAEALLRAGVAADDPWSYANLGRLLCDQGHREQAEIVFKEALERGHTLGLLNYGNCLTEWEGREAEAEAVYREAIANGDEEGHLNLGTLLGDLGRPDEAEAEYRTAIELGDDMAHVAYGEFLLKVGRRDEAMEQLERAAASGFEEDVEEILADADR